MSSEKKVSKFFLLFVVLFLIVNVAIIYSQQKSTTSETGLLFYLSGDNGFNADYSKGKAEPNYLNGVKLINDGAKGSGIECDNEQVYSYWAPGNIYAERGTLSFYWRSRDSLGKTAFPIFRVAYADHSSWDMVWLRIDYNGNGYDAFVTDVNLARIRVSYKLPSLPLGKEWTHFALTWDENTGIKFYINGSKVAQKDTSDVFYTGLDQFGPHSRSISPYEVQSAYNFVKGGDIDEIKIYDQALTDKNISELALGNVLTNVQELKKDLSQQKYLDEWKLRYGWNRPGDYPPYLEQNETSICKVEIHDTYDLKRWWWKANDGIRETTWPGVYNRSRILGRNDYFQLPDWDCYVESGKSVRFNMPDENWNYIEVTGAANGKFSLSSSKDGSNPKFLFDRPKGQERTFHKLSAEITGNTLVFNNEIQETPIGELNAYNIQPGKAPKGFAVLEYKITSDVEPDNLDLKNLEEYIAGRFSPDERNTMLALPKGASRSQRPKSNQSFLPIVHILIPSDFRNINSGIANLYNYGWDNMSAGLDGIEIQLPALNVRPTIGEYFPLNIQVKDPVWPLRNLFDCSFSVKPNEARTLWLDLRDKILPNGKPIYITFAASGSDFNSSILEGANIKLVFKSYKDATKEHVIDRFTQIRDNYGMIIEEHADDKRLNKYNQLAADATELFRVDPEHYLGRTYWYDNNMNQPKPSFKQPEPPTGVPLWAFRQVENLKSYQRLVNWYIDHRQSDYGDFGGGISDDTDLGNLWPGLALMGCDPDKVLASDSKLLESCYKNGMLTDGLPTIQTDGLHAYEEGANVLSQVNLLDFGNPKNVERMMEMTRNLKEKIIGVNNAGHHHFRSGYYGANSISEEGVWEWNIAAEYLILQPAIYLGEFYGNQESKQLVLNMADGILAHAKKDSQGKTILDVEFQFSTDKSRPSQLGNKGQLQSSLTPYRNMNSKIGAIHLFWSAWRWTKDDKYLQPLLDMGPYIINIITSNALDIVKLRETWGKKIAEETTPDTKDLDFLRHISWQVTGNKKYLENYYADEIENNTNREFINTEGSLWTDRIYISEREIQRSRLGGLAFSRNEIYPGHAISWKYKAPATGLSTAVLVHSSNPSELKLEIYNLEKFTVAAELTGWDVLPGQWEIIQGIDKNGDTKADEGLSTRQIKFGRSESIDLKFPPRTTSVVTLKLVKEGLNYSKRPDLGISKEDIKIEGNQIKVTVHNIGAVDAVPTKIALVNSNGKVIAEVQTPIIKAPLDLIPKTAEVVLNVSSASNLKGISIQIDPDGKLEEITKMNNKVNF